MKYGIHKVLLKPRWAVCMHRPRLLGLFPQNIFAEELGEMWPKQVFAADGSVRASMVL
jgi:hypothetical protein